MALGNQNNTSIDGKEGLRLGFVRYTRGLGRKRIVISNEVEGSSPLDSSATGRLKRQCSEKIMSGDCADKSVLESLPQDIIIRILCGVNHEDLKQLYFVSKTIREAAVIAKRTHFLYSTPTKIRAFRTSIDFQEQSEMDDIEPPSAPRQPRPHRARISGKSLASISVALFS